MVTLYYGKGADLSLLDGNTVAVIGYGSQGHAQALNAKDSSANRSMVCCSRRLAKHCTI